MEPNPLSTAQLVKLMRMQAGQSQKELADAIGVHPNTVANLENGRQDPIHWLRAIEEATGKPPGWSEAFLDPLAFIVRQQDDITHIRETVDEILELTKPIRDGTHRKRR